jgi:hypothetical protein
VITIPDSYLAVLQAMDRLGAHDAASSVVTGKIARESARSSSVTAHILRGLARTGLVARTDLPEAWGYHLTATGIERARP